MQIAYTDVIDRLAAILRSRGLSADRAQLAARLFADASRDGTESHGANRFPGFIKMIERGLVDVNAQPTLVESFGALERWDGELGPGMLNAHFAMSRAMDLASVGAIGVIGLRNTNHWMRGANYGWQAVESGCIGVCWTNTQPNVAPWGGVRSAVGNNPLVIGIPREDGHVVLDMAMSQFSFGRLGKHVRSGEPLPVVGGVDASGAPTTDAAAIFDGGRVLPIGHWKGAGLSLMLDLIAALVSGGRTTREIGELETEYGVSQMFVAIDLSQLGDRATQNALVDDAVAFVHHSVDSETGAGVSTPRYPGEASHARRRESERSGVHIDDEVWQRITALETTPRTS